MSRRIYGIFSPKPNTCNPSHTRYPHHHPLPYLVVKTPKMIYSLVSIMLLAATSNGATATPVEATVRDDPRLLKLSNVCGNATQDLQVTLVNATADWLDAIAQTYNLTTLDAYCYTPHYTSSCALNFTSLPEEAAWRAACTAAGGIIYEINEMRYRCKESTTDYVRLLNFIGHAECVPTADLCPTAELDDNHETLVADEAALFQSLFNDADCELEDEYVVAGATTKVSMTLVLTSIVAAMTMVGMMW
eukprot:scaffold3842_cov158-Amphora_coffeaeformis.AAC.2